MIRNHLLAIGLLFPIISWGSFQKDSVTTTSRVQTNVGLIEGIVNPDGIHIFRGVPYAKPPIGELRWMPPKPLEKWKGIRDAKTFKFACPQDNTNWGDVSEDCLCLNVFSTNVFKTKNLLPVMVWIHGGGFIGGSAKGFEGDVLARKGVVVVTFNYRLGVLGFLAHPALRTLTPENSSGNYGLLDQIAVLRWVKLNIVEFGGDADNVTIFGESGGGFSVGALIASPLAKGLFHRAILQSGNGIHNGILTREEATQIAFAGAEKLGIKGSGNDALIALRKLKPEELTKAFSRGKTSDLKGYKIWMGPVIDTQIIPVPLDKAISTGAWNKVPVMVGITAAEGVRFQAIKPCTSVDEYNMMIKALGDDTGKLSALYPVKDTSFLLTQAREFVGDKGFGAPARALARLVASNGGQAYFYHFSRESKDSDGRIIPALHTTELPFVFGYTPDRWIAYPQKGTASYDKVLAETMSNYWIAFASKGNPNATLTKIELPSWPAYSIADDFYLDIGEIVVAKQHLRKEKYDAHDEIARQNGEIRP